MPTKVIRLRRRRIRGHGETFWTAYIPLDAKPSRAGIDHPRVVNICSSSLDIMFAHKLTHHIDLEISTKPLGKYGYHVKIYCGSFEVVDYEVPDGIPTIAGSIHFRGFQQIWIDLGWPTDVWFRVYNLVKE